MPLAIFLLTCPTMGLLHSWLIRQVLHGSHRECKQAVPQACTEISTWSRTLFWSPTPLSPHCGLKHRQTCKHISSSLKGPYNNNNKMVSNWKASTSLMTCLYTRHLNMWIWIEEGSKWSGNTWSLEGRCYCPGIHLVGSSNNIRSKCLSTCIQI